MATLLEQLRGMTTVGRRFWRYQFDREVQADGLDDEPVADRGCRSGIGTIRALWMTC